MRQRELMKTLQIMKLPAILLLVFCLAASSAVNAQNVTLSAKNEPLENIFKEIKKQTGYDFWYENKLMQKAERVDISVTNLPLNQVLDMCFKNQPFTWSIVGKIIVVKPKEAVASTAAMPVAPASRPTEIKGNIRNEKGDPVSNASVTVKGTSIGTAASANGDFAITVPDTRNLVLVVSSVGYMESEVKVGSSAEVNVVLKEKISPVEEIVVIGYGSQRKTDVTSAVASVKSENFVTGAVRDAGQLIQGKVAGLTIGLPSGDPTTNSQIQLRGTATLFTSTQPLVLIDGVPGDMNSIAPEDIESIDVLKDGSAAAIYGTRGTNGVILIKTKRADGRSLQPTINYSGYVSTQKISKKPEMLDAADYRKLISQGVAFQDLGANTDWVDAISRSTPISHVHTLSLKGGNGQTNYIGSINYRSLQGIFLKSDNRTINARIDVNHNMFNNKLRFNFNLINSDNKYETVTLGGLNTNRTVNTDGIDASYNGFIYRQSLIRNPTAPIRNPDGTWAEQIAIDSYVNPVALLEESNGQTSSQTSRISGSVTWLPISGLNLKALVSRNRRNQVFGYSETKENISTIRDGKNGYGHKSDFQSIDKLLELTAEYSKTINDHNFSVLGGYSYQDFSNESSDIQNWDFPAGNYSYVDNIGSGNALKTGAATMGSYKSVANLVGFFGRVTYSYKSKYLLMGNLRYEASSRLVGTNDPWGLFPAISAGWKIDKENFMQNVKFINELKLRVGYGVTGTAPDALFLGVSRLGYDGGYAYIGGQWVPTLAPVSNPNPYLRWEEKHETNAGLDFSLFNRKISGSIDYYKRTTKGLLYDYPVPTPPNLYGITKANVGVMDNKGIEVLLNYAAVQTKDLTWNSGLNFSTNTNKLVSLTNDLYKLTNNYINVGYTGSPVQTYTHRIEVGKPIGNFYGYEVVGVTDDGKWIYSDKDGKETTTKGGEENKKILGNGLPKYYLGWNNSLRYKHLDFGVTMRGAFGFEILNFTRMYYENPGTTQYNQLKSAQDKVFGKAVLDKNVLPEYNSYYIEKGDFWKIDNITLGYNINTGVTKSLRVYVALINAFTFTGYKGNDPEVNRLGVTPGDDDRDKYPATRIYTAGVNVTF
jgi:TonB-linked SusC/RagA family outer membrane protein